MLAINRQSYFALDVGILLHKQGGANIVFPTSIVTIDTGIVYRVPYHAVHRCIVPSVSMVII